MLKIETFIEEEISTFFINFKWVQEKRVNDNICYLIHKFM